MPRRRLRKQTARKQTRALLRALFPAAPARRRSRRASPSTPTARIPKATTPPTRPRPAGKKAAADPARAPGAGTWHHARYVGVAGSRPYAVYVPRGLRRRAAVPLLVLLHGCGQRPADFAAATRFNQVADRQGFVVAYPEQTPAHNSQRCWNWFERGHQARGAGEPAILAGITEQVAAEPLRWRIDPARVYVAGLSAGGAMALVLGATYPDLYAAVGVHSAPPYGSASSGSAALRAMAGRGVVQHAHSGPGTAGMPPTVVVQGSHDTTVRAANGDLIVEQWLAFHEAFLSGPADPNRIIRSTRSTARAGKGRAYTLTRWYTARGHKRLEAWHVEGLGHAWSGGLRGGSFSDPQGPRASTLMWSFLSAQRLASPARVRARRA